MPKVVVITGASSGLGENIAHYLYTKGHKVWGTSRNIEKQKKAFRTINLDVTSEESIQSALHKILIEEGRIDVFINNAGLGIASPVETLSITDTKSILETNIIGTIQCCQAVLPYMRSQGSGLIINISSIGSETGLPYRGLYSASKAAVDRLTEAMRIELAPFGVQACIVQPGGIQTNINSNRIKVDLPDSDVYRKSFETTYELINESVDRGLHPSEVSKLVEELICTKKLKRLYRIGKPVEKLSVLLKRILPSTLYESMIRRHYKIKK